VKHGEQMDPEKGAPVDSELRPMWLWGSGNGGGALVVVLDEHRRAIGWLCDCGTGSDYGPRTECFRWWLDGGRSGEDADYDRARAALGSAATEHLARLKVSGIKNGDGERE
jgi:hypothetical protein